LHADKGDDANAIRQQVEERGVMPNIPPKAGPGGCMKSSTTVIAS
jgi:hypothetical protein